MYPASDTIVKIHGREIFRLYSFPSHFSFPPRKSSRTVSLSYKVYALFFFCFARKALAGYIVADGDLCAHKFSDTQFFELPSTLPRFDPDNLFKSGGFVFYSARVSRLSQLYIIINSPFLPREETTVHKRSSKMLKERSLSLTRNRNKNGRRSPNSTGDKKWSISWYCYNIRLLSLSLLFLLFLYTLFFFTFIQYILFEIYFNICIVIFVCYLRFLRRYYPRARYKWSLFLIEGAGGSGACRLRRTYSRNSHSALNGSPAAAVPYGVMLPEWGVLSPGDSLSRLNRSTRAVTRRLALCSRRGNAQREPFGVTVRRKSYTR